MALEMKLNVFTELNIKYSTIPYVTLRNRNTEVIL